MGSISDLAALHRHGGLVIVFEEDDPTYGTNGHLSLPVELN